MPKPNKEHYFFSNQKYITFLTIALNVIAEINYPKFRSRFSNKQYNQHQLLALLLLKEYLHFGYRDLIETIELMDPIQKQLDLKTIPHYSTLCKFSDRISSDLFNRLIRGINRFYPRDSNKCKIVAIDSSGMILDHASLYYSWRTGKNRKNFLKLSLAVETNTLSIISCKVKDSHHHDSIIAPSLIRESSRLNRGNCYVMDKGYDSESLHAFINEEINAESVIPPRIWGNNAPSSYYRQMMYYSFPYEKYRRRNLVESVFSVIKRLFSERIRSRNQWKQRREVKLKCLCYLIHRFSRIQRVFNII